MVYTNFYPHWFMFLLSEAIFSYDCSSHKLKLEIRFLQVWFQDWIWEFLKTHFKREMAPINSPLSSDKGKIWAEREINYLVILCLFLAFCSNLFWKQLFKTYLSLPKGLKNLKILGPFLLHHYPNIDMEKMTYFNCK